MKIQLIKALFAIVLSAAFLVFSSLSLARSVSMVTVDWPPFYGAELEEDGVITAIVTEAFRRGGHNASIQFIPWRRALVLVAKTDRDVLMGAYYTKERNKTYLYSDPLYDIEVGLVALKSLNVDHYDTLKELSPYNIGVSPGWAYGDEFDKAIYLHKEEASNQILNVRKLFKQRVDMIAISFEVFRYEALGMSGNKLSQVVFVQPPLMVAPIYLIVSRALNDAESLIQSFNQGLKSMRQDGTYQDILTQYNFQQSPHSTQH